MAVATSSPPRHMPADLTAAIVAAAASGRGSCTRKALAAMVSALCCQGCMCGTKTQPSMVTVMWGCSAMPLQRAFAGDMLSTAFSWSIRNCKAANESS